MAKMIERIRSKTGKTVAVAIPGIGKLAAKVESVEDDEVVTLVPEDAAQPKIAMHYTQFIILFDRG